MPTAAASLPSLSVEETVRLPAEVGEASFFALADGPPVWWDLTGSRWISKDAVRGLVELARTGPVYLRLAPGYVQDRLFQLTGGLLRRLDGEEWWLCLP
jgi:hypothetical protein